MSLVSTVKGKYYWAKQKPLFWANLLLAALTWLVVCVYPGPLTDAGPSDTRIRVWAMFLQLLGAWFVWYDLTGTAREFGKGGLIGGTWAWLKAAIGTQTISAPLVTSGAVFLGGRVRASARRTPPPESSPEVRLDALEFNLSRIDNDLSDALREIDANAAMHSEGLTAERRAREAANKALDEKLQRSIVGNYSCLLFGALWVAVGIVLSSLSPEIAKAAAGQWSQVWKALY